MRPSRIGRESLVSLTVTPSVFSVTAPSLGEDASELCWLECHALFQSRKETDLPGNAIGRLLDTAEAGRGRQALLGMGPPPLFLYNLLPHRTPPGERRVSVSAAMSSTLAARPS